MRKFGFTLAEVLITLAIVGVTAALTIPTVVSDNKNKANAAKLSTTMSELENAFTSMIATETVNDLSETEFGINPSAATLGKYLKINSSAANLEPFGYTDESDQGGDFKTLTSGNQGISCRMAFQLKNGAVMCYGNPAQTGSSEATTKNMGGALYDAQGSITIDVNGKELPNIWGRDVFAFLLGTDGLLYPYGGRNVAIYLYGDNYNLWTWDVAETDDLGCNDTIKGLGCTARLIENNFKIDY